MAKKNVFDEVTGTLRTFKDILFSSSQSARGHFRPNVEQNVIKTMRSSLEGHVARKDRESAPQPTLPNMFSVITDVQSTVWHLVREISLVMCTRFSACLCHSRRINVALDRKIAERFSGVFLPCWEPPGRECELPPAHTGFSGPSETRQPCRGLPPRSRAPSNSCLGIHTYTTALLSTVNVITSVTTAALAAEKLAVISFW